MRKQIYLAIIDCLKAADIGIQHISLWNENTTALEQANGFGLPAVFVEFAPIKWGQQLQRVKNGTARVSLHIVTGTLADPSDGSNFQFDALQMFDIIDNVVAAVQGLSVEGFNKFQHVETIPDHDHEEVQNDVEIFTTEITDSSAQRKREVCINAKAVIK